MPEILAMGRQEGFGGAPPLVAQHGEKGPLGV